jgi:hypothetical protein
MATPERQDTTAPEPWYAPVDAIIANARTELSRDWSDYLRLIEESWPTGSVEPVACDTLDAAARATRRARRRLLAGPKSLEPSWLQWEEIGRLNPGIGDPEEITRLFNAAAREPKMQPLERRFCGRDAGRAAVRPLGRRGSPGADLSPDLVSPTASGRLAKRDYADWHGAAVVRAPAPPNSRDAAGSAHGARNGVHRRGRDTAYPAASVVRSVNWGVCT